jgi:hypothetical protein
MKYSGLAGRVGPDALWLTSSLAAILHPVLSAFHGYRSGSLETHGPLGVIWVGLGLCGFYIALVWINTLLGFVLTPLFIVPLTWLHERVRGKAPARG